MASLDLTAMFSVFCNHEYWHYYLGYISYNFYEWCYNIQIQGPFIREKFKLYDKRFWGTGHSRD